MPNVYISGRFLFVKNDEDFNGAYYTVINMSAGGKHWDRNHKFTSTSEMDEYASTH